MRNITTLNSLRLVAILSIVAAWLAVGTAHAQTVTWDGSGDTTWSADPDATSWGGGVDTVYNDGDAVIIPNGFGNPTLTGTVSPGSITINGGLNILNGGGSIAGATGITKTGPGWLNIASGNSFDGTVNITGGGLWLSNSSALGSSTGNTIINNGTALNLAGTNVNTGEDFTIRGSAWDGAGGVTAISSTTATATLGSGTTITLAADAEIGGSGPYNARINNFGNFNGGGFNLTKSGTSQWWQWGGGNVNIGTLTIGTGSDSAHLGFGGTADLANNSTGVIVKSGANMETWGNGHNFTAPITFENNATFRNNWDAALTSTHTISGPVTLSGTVNIDGNGNTEHIRRTLTISGDITGSGGIDRRGSQTLILSGDNSAWTGQLRIFDNGRVQVGSTTALHSGTAVNILSTGDFELTGTDTTIGSLTGTQSAQVENGSGTAATLTVGGLNTDTIYEGTITDGGSGSFGLVKTGTGDLHLNTGGSGVLDYTGTTVVSAGTLTVDGDYTGGGTWTVQSGATLAGGGSINGDVTFEAGSIFDPSIFDLTFTGTTFDISATVATGSETMQFTVGDDSLDTVFMGASTLEIGSDLEFDDFLFTPSNLQAFNTYTLFDAGTINGSLGAFTGGTVGGFAATLEIQGNDLVLVLGDLLIAPEPSTVMLIATGGMVLAVFRRRRQNRS